MEGSDMRDSKNVDDDDDGDMLPNQAWCMGMMISTLALALSCQCMMKRGISQV